MPHIITDELKAGMRVVIKLPWSEIWEYEYGKELWQLVEVNWGEFLSYVSGNLIPDRAGRVLPRNRGRKPHNKTKRTDILNEFDKLNLSGKHGELSSAAKILSKKFRDYKQDSIRKIIQPVYARNFLSQSVIRHFLGFILFDLDAACMLGLRTVSRSTTK